MGELLDIYDENMTLVGVKDRDAVHRDGDWHKAFHCWVVYRDQAGDWIVVQRRAPDKKLFPNALDITAAGHYLTGETIVDGLREVREELGIEVAYSSLVPLGVKFDIARVGGMINRELDDVFLLDHAADIATYNFQISEVSGLAVFNIDQGLALFAGEVPTIDARAVMAGAGAGVARSESLIEVRVSDFIPRIDAYVYKILILGKRYLNGERHLVI